MAIQNPSDIRLNDRSDLEAVIGHPPGWAHYWGMTAMLLVLALIVGIAWFVRYPDIVSAPAVFTTENPPIRLMAGGSARIRELRVKNGDPVGAGSLLAVLENPAALPDVERLAAFLAALGDGQGSGLARLSLPAGLQLGHLEAGAAEVDQALKKLQFEWSKDIDLLKIGNLRQQMGDLQSFNQSLSRQEGILSEEVSLARLSKDRDSILVSKNSLSRAELDQSVSHYLAKRRELEALRSGKAQNNLKIRQLEAQVLDLKGLRSDEESALQLDLRSKVSSLQGELEQWRQTWLITAPIGGHVALTRAWSVSQFVKQGEEVMTVVPAESAGQVIAKAVLPGPSSGKVKAGMGVFIRLDGYPYQEYGVLNAEVLRVAAVPTDAGYEADLSLPKGMVTSHGKPIAFQQEMRGQARIVTEERNLLQRVLEKVLSVFEP